MQSLQNTLREMIRKELNQCSGNCGEEAVWEYIYIPSMQKEYVLRSTCDKCLPLVQPEQPIAEVSKETYEARWKKICPAGYRDTDLKRIPSELWHLVNTRSSKPPGLLLTGPTGTWKSRSVYAFLEIEFYAGKSVVAFDSAKFSEEMISSFNDPVEDYTTFLNKCSTCDRFFLDDLGQAKLTERVQEALFAIVERRMSANKPIYITTNLVSKSLKLMLDPQRGDAFLRRLAESCRVIKTDIYATKIAA